MFETAAQETNIWRTAGPAATSETSAAGESSPVRWIASTRAESQPEYSPDGERVVFYSRRSGNAEIWVCDRGGSNAVQMTSIGGPGVGSPRWSPDGRHIAFDSSKEGQIDIYVVSTEGGPPRRLTTEAAADFRPAWSTDGRWIYFGSDRSGDTQIWKVPAQGGEAVQLTTEGGYEAIASADGKFVYYTRQGAGGIWRVPVEGGEEIQILDQGGTGGFTVTGEGICFLARGADLSRSIQFFNFATKRTTPIRTFAQDVISPFGRLSVSPDGRWILYVQADESERDIMMVENFR